MAKRWIVTALGKDRPGIVAGVTKVLYGLGCNLEDSAMTRLEGEFAIMLIFSGGPSVSADRLCRAFGPLERRLHLVVHVKPLTRQETTAPRKKGQQYLITVYGADKAGIVFRVSDLLAQVGVNVTDLHTHRSAGRGGRKSPSLYLLLLEVELPARRSLASLEQRLKSLARRMGVEVTLRPAEPDVL